MIAHFKKIAGELGLTEKQVGVTAGLLDEGATVPFISRYRKELTGSLDEVQVAAIRDRVLQLRDLEKRREAILKSLQELGHLTPELEEKVSGAETMTSLEDIYLPYRPKRKTRASMAREKGLQPLADLLLQQEPGDVLAWSIRKKAWPRPRMRLPGQGISWRSISRNMRKPVPGSVRFSWKRE